MSRELPVATFDLRAPVIWVVPLATLAAFLAVLLMRLNEPLFHALNAIGPLTSDELWASITVLGDTVVALALCLVLWRRRPDLTWALVLGGLLSIAWVHTLKQLVPVQRPPLALGEQVHVIGKPYRKRSFPSGHSTTIFLVGGLLVMGMGAGRSGEGRGGRPSPGPAPAAPDSTRRLAAASRVAGARRCAAGALAVAALVAISRCVVGVHWPLDLLAGAFGGWVAAALGLELARRTLGFGTRPPVQWIAGALLAGCAAALVIGYDSDYPQAMTFQRIVGALCVAAAVLTFVGRPATR
jgi:membrane-associated phospholipid phosphatase